MIEFFIPGTPVAMPRPKFVRATGRVYVPDKKGLIEAFKESVALAVAEVEPPEPHDGPFCVNRRYVFPRTKGETWKKKVMRGYMHTKKPDIDNLDKLLFDAITRTGMIWRDDCQVCDGASSKWVCSGEEEPGTWVWISEL